MTMVINQQNLIDRFFRYAKIDTQSDPFSTSFPSTEKQKNLSRLLVKELQEMGIKDAEIDGFGYVFGTIPSNSNKKNVETVCFCSHVDTAPDVTGKDVNPILHKNYNGDDIVLPDDNSQILSAKQHPYLSEKIGEDIITASGNTLLGADDKAGVAIIMQLVEELLQRDDIIHGDIRILFTPDEEVGRGVDFLNMKKLNADVGYTLDGGKRGMIEGDTFSANAMTFSFTGVSAHPGYAKDKMVHAIKVASFFVDSLPKDSLCPEKTEGSEGFVHPTGIRGALETCEVDFIIRDFNTVKLEDHQQVLINIAKTAINEFPGSSFTYEVKEQYRNMREILDHFPHIEKNAIEAMKRAGVEPKVDLVRGGTDGSRLSFMGLPCPNIFTGEMAIHSKLEYVSVQDMEAAIQTLVELVQIYEEQGTN